MSNEKVARFNKHHSVVGLKETLKALKKNRVTSLIIAQDVEVYLLSDVLSKINHSDISVSFFESKKALGEFAGINVDAAIVALLIWELVSNYAY